MGVYLDVFEDVGQIVELSALWSGHPYLGNSTFVMRCIRKGERAWEWSVWPIPHNARVSNQQRKPMCKCKSSSISSQVGIFNF